MSGMSQNSVANKYKEIGMEWRFGNLCRREAPELHHRHFVAQIAILSRTAILLTNSANAIDDK